MTISLRGQSLYLSIVQDKECNCKECVCKFQRTCLGCKCCYKQHCYDAIPVPQEPVSYEIPKTNIVNEI